MMVADGWEEIATEIERWLDGVPAAAADAGGRRSGWAPEALGRVRNRRTRRRNRRMRSDAHGARSRGATARRTGR